MSFAFLLDSRSAWDAPWQLHPEGFRSFCKTISATQWVLLGQHLATSPLQWHISFLVFFGESHKTLKLLKVIQSLDGTLLMKGGCEPSGLPENTLGPRWVVRGMLQLTRGGSARSAPGQLCITSTQCKANTEACLASSPVLDVQGRKAVQCKNPVHLSLHHQVPQCLSCSSFRRAL